jgi:hypothetical protein
MSRVPQWAGLTDGQRVLVVLAVVTDSVAKAVALRNLRRRPAEQVRGPRWLWGAAVALTGSAGAVPLPHLAVGRRAPAT